MLRGHPLSVLIQRMYDRAAQMYDTNNAAPEACPQRNTVTSGNRHVDTHPASVTAEWAQAGWWCHQALELPSAPAGLLTLWIAVAVKDSGILLARGHCTGM